MSSFRRCGNESNAEAASPVAKQVSETGCVVILMRAQLRIGNYVCRHEEEAIPESLKTPGDYVVAAVRRQIESAVIPHGCRHRQQAYHQQHPCWHELALNEPRGDWRE